MEPDGFDHAGMARKRLRNRLRKPPDTLYIGEWLAALGIKQVEVVKRAGVDKGYLSQLISNKRQNPSTAYLRQISNYIGIPLEKLYEPPPAPHLIQEIADLDPTVLDRLLARRRDTLN